MVRRESVFRPDLRSTIRISITRLKHEINKSLAARIAAINDKNLDYEIETKDFLVGCGACDTINDKNLDYEIETQVPWDQTVHFHPTINDKNLDYEIETYSERSILRWRAQTINDKNLDYEIETWTELQRLQEREANDQR